MRIRSGFFLSIVFIAAALGSHRTLARAPSGPEDPPSVSGSGDLQEAPAGSIAGRFVDAQSGSGVEDLVQRALQRNGELLAAREQIEVGNGQARQARLRSNPMVEVSSLQQIRGSDNNIMVGGSLPLELFGRRAARVNVADRELEVMRLEVADRERQLMAAVRSKYAETLTAILNLRFAEELLRLNRESYRLISARVDHGASAPIERDLESVEVSRIEAMQSDYEARVELGLLELRNLAGMRPEDPLVLKDGFDLPQPATDRQAAISLALASRPDVGAARAAEDVTEARLSQARTEGRVDASLFANYERMDFGFDVNGVTPEGDVRRVQGIFHYLTYGLSIALPLRNRNQGAVQAASAEVAAARHRREFAELVLNREVSAAYIRLEKTRKSLDIYAKGVRDQARNNFRVVRQSYEFGRVPFTDVIAEQRRLIDIETGYSQVLNENYQALVEYQRSIGRVKE